MSWCCFTSNVSEPIKVSKVNESKVNESKESKESNVKGTQNATADEVAKAVAAVHAAEETLASVESALGSVNSHPREHVSNYSPMSMSNIILLGIIVIIIYTCVLNPDTHTLKYIRKDREDL